MRAIEIENWRGKTPLTIRGDLASFALEARAGKVEKRVNTGAVRFSDFSQLEKSDPLGPEDQATKQIIKWAREDIPSIEIRLSSPSEEEILLAMSGSTEFNTQTMALWISPPKEGVYNESRFVFYQTLKVNGEKYLFFRALCGPQSSNECLSIAQTLISSSVSDRDYHIDDPEQLRATPLSFVITGVEPWTERLSKVIILPEVWRAIENGDDIKLKIEALAAADKITDVYSPLISRALRFDHQRLGARIEGSLEKELGIKLTPGACGTLYSSFEPKTWATVIPLGLKSSSSLEKKSKFIRNCGACGKKLNMNMSKGDRCPWCGGVYEGC